jgi:predicted TIM-barrel fold metal-dependent hydrolase
MAPGSMPARRIDVHHHIIPPFQKEALESRKLLATPATWTAALSLEDMDKNGVEKAVVSVLNPGVWFGTSDEASRKLARQCNEFAADLARDHPHRFGFFAAIPLPDTEGSLREIEYALDTLKADGIALWTSYAGMYLGDPSFQAVFDELNRRKAVVFTHPTTPDCCRGLVKNIPAPAIEFPTDTTRTVASLLFGDGGTAFRTPDVRYIWAHSGGTLPFLSGRLVTQAKARPDPRMPDGPMPFLRRYHYEIAQGHTAGQLAALLKMVPASQLLLGSDFPFRKTQEAVEGLGNYEFTSGERRGIDRDNAVALMPSLQAKG